MSNQPILANNGYVKNSFELARKIDERSYRLKSVINRDKGRKPSGIQSVPGFHIFFRYYAKLEANLYKLKTKIFTRLSGDVKARRDSLKGQVKAARSYYKFIHKNSEAVIDLLASKENQITLKLAEQIFNETVSQSEQILVAFKSNGEELLTSIQDESLHEEMSVLFQKILSDGAQAIDDYQYKKDTLFLAGLFSVYKNEFENLKGVIYSVKFKNLKNPSTLDMVKTVGGSVKIITDSLIPSFVEFIHKKIVSPICVKEMGLNSPRKESDERRNRETLRGRLTKMSEEEINELNAVYTKLTENYRSRGFSKHQISYFENYKRLLKIL